MAKPKRNRAVKSANKKINTRSNQNNPAFENMGIAQPPSGAIPVIKAELKIVPAGVKDLSYIGHEILWIMITTGIVIILLVVAYLIFR
jgi:hypothetical protein